MKPVIHSVLALGLILTIQPTPAAEPGAASEDRWAEAMERFERLDGESPPRPGGVVFVGSSSIRLWDLEKFFPELEAVNRGFGGSQLADSLRHIDLLVLRHKPRAVVVYAGDNDINAGKTPGQVSEDFRAFEAAVHDALPETRILYIAIKPSLARWKLAGPMRTANGLIAEICEKHPRCDFVNIWDPMLGDDGKPRDELLQEDGLHLSPAGYALWTKLVQSALDPADQATNTNSH